MQNRRVSVSSILRPGAAWFIRHPFFEIIFLAFLLTLIVEMLSRQSILAGFQYLVSKPFAFGLNGVIILASLSIALLVHRRGFVIALVSTFWLSLGTTNCVLLCFRSTPLAAIDFVLIPSVFTVFKVYLKPIHVVVLALAIIAVIALLVLAWRKLPKRKVTYQRAFINVAVILAIFFVSLNLAARTEGIATGFKNLPDAYRDYGFIYCFSISVLDRGIDRPDNYAEDTVQNVVDEITPPQETTQETEPVTDSVTPNIIMLQMESFFDPKSLADVDFSEDPVPVFTALKEKYGSAYLTVPYFGAGTANTEFEVLSGMSLDYFGAGEYPYKTILQNNVCESICYDLKELGYACRAIHNHEGTFYDRNRVFANLGFDAYTSLEYMQNVKTNALGWAKDNVLTGEITKALQATEEQDFIYTITVQPHGKYPSDVEEKDENVDVNGLEEIGDKDAFSYYLSQLQESDAFLGDLINTLTDFDEPVVLVAFGDHLPGFNIKPEELVNGSIFETQYVVWSNYELPVQYRDLSAYQLSAFVMGLLGFDNGVLTKFHQSCWQNADYEEKLELLQYDMLYGDKNAYGGKSPYQPTELKMGTDKIDITDVFCCNDTLYVSGDNFTPWSVVCLDGKPKDSKFLGANLLSVSGAGEDGEYWVTVAQMADNREILSETEPYFYWVSP